MAPQEMVTLALLHKRTLCRESGKSPACLIKENNWSMKESNWSLISVNEFYYIKNDASRSITFKTSYI